MKNLLVISLLVLAAPSLAKEVHEVRDAEARAEIVIYNTAGEVEVRGWSRNQVEINADLGKNVKELVFKVDGKEVYIEVKAPGHGGRDIASDLVINVPENSSLEISTVSADVSVADVLGRQEVDTVSGDIEIAAYASDVDIETVSGDVEIGGDDEKMRVRADSVSGDMDFQNLNGEVEIDTVSGDVVLNDSRFESAEAQTVSGDIVFRASLYGERRMNIETVNGDINIKFNGDVSARFDIETFNGSIRNCFGPEATRTSKYAPGRELKFSEGGGDGKVVIRTLNGDLRLCKD
jgi:DUF4097 and DUF4098 domain-containing protein YvlB